MEEKEMTAGQIVKYLFENRDMLPEVTCCLKKENSSEASFVIKIAVFRLAEAFSVVGNVLFGGCAFINDFNTGYDRDKAEARIERWVKMIANEEGVGKSQYLENLKELPEIERERHLYGNWNINRMEVKGKRFCKPEITVVIEEGMLTDVYSTDRRLSVNVIDKDVTDDEAQEIVDSELAEVKEKHDAGDLFLVY